jgi:hypothetical protein
MGTPPAKIVHPLHTDGAQAMRPRLGCQLLILLLPFFACAIWSTLPIGIETLWRQISFNFLLALGLAVLLWGVLYLIAQYTTQIRLLDHLLVVSVFSTWWSLKVESQSLRGFCRKLLTGAEKHRLQLLVGALTTVVILGCLILFGQAIVILILGPGKVRSPEALHTYFLIALFTLMETAVYGLAALSIIPTAWRVWQSDGVLLIWRHRSLGRLSWLFGPADLRVFAKQNELDTLEDWLTEHEVARLPE